MLVKNHTVRRRRNDHLLEREHAYEFRLRVALACSLLLTIVLIVAALHIPFRHPRTPLSEVTTIAVVPEIAPTVQGSPARTPSRPKVPVPVPMEDLPEVIPVDEFRVSLEEFDAGMGMGGTGRQHALPGAGNPRPVVEVIPEYPDRLRKKGVSGLVELGLLVNQDGNVDSVWVLRNTTSNQELEHLAVNAAFRSKYMPLTSRGKMALRVVRQYEFRVQ
ncbi:MAG TPA: TonB family protein [bacterium]|nr:TonB family protein [bacterium]